MPKHRSGRVALVKLPIHAAENHDRVFQSLGFMNRHDRNRVLLVRKGRGGLHILVLAAQLVDVEHKLKQAAHRALFKRRAVFIK